MAGRLQTLLLMLALLLVGVFIVSFVDGVLGGRWSSGGDRGASASLGELPAELAPATPVEPARSASGRRIRVEVLNGAGRAGLARRATDVLRDAGFDVVYFGNAREFDRDSTVAIDRAGDAAAARAVAEAMGGAAVESVPDPRLHLEVTVVLGRDWTPPDPLDPEGRLPTGRLWRRLLRR